MATSGPRTTHRPSPAIAASGLALALLSLLAATSGPARAKVEPPAGGFARIGLGSCAARGCHGAVGPTEPARGEAYIPGGAYTTWRAFDPHARASAVLLEPRSRSIAARLSGPLRGAPAHEARACLACHASPGPPPEAASPTAARGIDCEGCHGPAGRWGEAHLALDWIAKSPAAKAEAGLSDLSTPRARAEGCVGCHVGDRSRGMDVNHDLLAAGHPRLNFEYASYLAALPKHWREPRQKARAVKPSPGSPVDFEAKSWAVGQAVTARAVLRLLADRADASTAEALADDGAGPSSPWPEFAESECFACHHVPSGPGPRPSRGPRAIGGPGRLPWATWPSAMLPALAGDRPDVDPSAAGSAWSRLRVEMALPEPDAAKVAGLAREGDRSLDAWVGSLEMATFDAGRVEALIAGLSKVEPGRVDTWDASAQRYLAIEALIRAWKDLGGGLLNPDAARLIESAPARLAFPPDYDSPRGGRTSPGP